MKQKFYSKVNMEWIFFFDLFAKAMRRNVVVRLTGF